MYPFLRFFLPMFLVAYLGIAFFWRSWVVYRQTGINPFVLGRSDSAHDYLGKVFKTTVAGLIVVVVTYTCSPTWYRYFEPVLWLDAVWIQLSGIVLLLVSFAWTAVAQAQMGASWRIGVDHERETELVEAGLFERSRNPIFLGMRVTLFGFFLCLPNALTLTIFVLSEVLIQVQVRLEEEHLLRIHGDAYVAYQQRVRRWI